MPVRRRADRTSVVIWEAQNLGDSGEYVNATAVVGGSNDEEDLELLITTDDPGEDTLEEDTFHLQADNTTARRSVSRALGKLKEGTEETLN